MVEASTISRGSGERDDATPVVAVRGDRPAAFLGEALGLGVLVDGAVDCDDDLSEQRSDLASR